MLESSYLFRLLAITTLSLFLFSSPVEAAKLPTLAGVVAQNRILTKLELLLTGADLNSLLASKGPFTLFAPTDSAFAKLSPDFLDNLLLPQNKEALQKLVFYHLIEGKKISAHDLVTGNLLTFSGLSLTIKKSKLGLIQIEGSKVLRADIHCQNGIIHQIDRVLVPAGFTLAATDSSAPTPNQLNSSQTTNTPSALPPSTDTNVPAHSVPALPVSPGTP